MTSGRKDCTSGAQTCTPKSSREALYCQINHSQMTRNDLAEVMAINPTTLGKWGDPQGDERMPEERLLHLLRLTDDNLAFLRYYADLQGFVVYDPKSIAHGRTARMVSEFGELLKAIDARGDGTTVEEAERIEREGTELIAVVHQQIQDAKSAAAPLRAIK